MSLIVPILLSILVIGVVLALAVWQARGLHNPLRFRATLREIRALPECLKDRDASSENLR